MVASTSRSPWIDLKCKALRITSAAAGRTTASSSVKMRRIVSFRRCFAIDTLGRSYPSANVNIVKRETSSVNQGKKYVKSCDLIEGKGSLLDGRDYRELGKVAELRVGRLKSTVTNVCACTAWPFMR